MSALGARIAAEIAATGPIPLAQFMTIALLDPAGGYYATRDPFGAQGDFVTAPEASQMFGELAGLWLGQAWHEQGEPGRPLLVEMGPGSGALMRDALRALKLLPAFRDNAEIVLVEASPVLKAQQQAALADFRAAVRWVESIEAVPHGRPLFLIANEFFDALPIRQFVRTERGWCERMVTLDATGSFTFALAPVPLPAGQVPANRDGAPLGGVYEMSAAGEALAEEIGHRIATDGGAALIVDYGYATPGFGETLQAVKSHRFADVLAEPGTIDLSAHVDFTALGGAARRGGAHVCGPATQGDFLDGLGIVQRAQRLGDFAGLDRLTSPKQMGTLFKALAIVPKSAPAPAGFG